MRATYTWNLAYMNRLAADRLLHNFRQNAGLPSSVSKPFGGWEAPNDGTHATELRGHFTGHFLSATALMHASRATRMSKQRATSWWMN
jgi:uncharacterized protein